MIKLSRMLPIVFLFTVSCRTGLVDKESSLDIIHGEPTNEYPAVVALSFKSDKWQGECSGTFISDSILLTAAHCVPFEDKNLTYNVEIGGKTLTSTAFFRHPEFKTMSQGQFPKAQDSRYDIAVIRFPPGTSKDTMVVKSGSIITAGTELTIVGFGGDSIQSEELGPQVKRKGTNTVKAAANGIFIMSDMLRKMLVNPVPGQLVAATKGDSGGPAIDKEGKLVGVTSIGTKVGDSTFFVFCDVSSPEASRFLAPFLGK